MTTLAQVLFLMTLILVMTKSDSSQHPKTEIKQNANPIINGFHKEMNALNVIHESEQVIQPLNRYNICTQSEQIVERSPRMSKSESNKCDQRCHETIQNLQRINKETQHTNQDNLMKRFKRNAQTAGTLPAPTPLNVEHTINEMFKERHEALWKRTMDVTLNNLHIEEMNKSETYRQFNIFYSAYKESLENWLKEYLGNELKFKMLDEQRPLMTSREYGVFKNQMDLAIETCRATLWRMLQELYTYIDLNVKHYVEAFQDKYESDEIIDYDQMKEMVRELGNMVQKQIAYR